MQPAASPTASAVTARAKQLHAELSARAGVLNAGVWFIGSEAELTPLPPAPDELASGSLLEPVRRFAAGEGDAEAAVGGKAVHLAKVGDRLGSQQLGTFVAGCFGTADDGAKLAKLLQWSHRDLAQRLGHESTIQQFSERLEQAYEETQLLFRMARLLNQVQRPEQSIQGMITQLHAIMPFGWLALRFSDDAHCIGGLRGRTALAGRPSVEAQAFDAQLRAAAQAVGGIDCWTKIATPADDPLAALTQADVLREPISDDGKPIGILLAGNKGGDDNQLSSFETQLFDAFADFLGIFHQNAARFERQQAMFLGTVRAMTAAIDAKDAYTRGHSERVALLAGMMAQAMHLDEAEVEQYRIGGLVHDVGKIGVPEAVLCKPGKLTDEEFAIIKRHPAIGHEILRDIPALAPMLPGVRHHHEKWNGHGYPDGLAAEQIPLIARVLALADTFDAMSSNRSYRIGLSRDRVLDEIAKCGGSQFDPELAQVFIRLDFRPFDEMIARHQAQQVPPALAA